MNEAFGRPHPEVRATVGRDGELVLTPWSAAAGRPGGPAASQIRPPKIVGVFDLTIERTQMDGITHSTDMIATEVFVTDGFQGGDRKLVEFAAQLGYERVWLGSEVVALESELLGGTWQSTCGRCGLTWADSSEQFWLSVRAIGYFPLVCWLCSNPITQPMTNSVGSERTTLEINRADGGELDEVGREFLASGDISE